MYHVKPLSPDLGSAAAFAVYAHLGDTFTQCRALCFNATDAGRVKLALALLDAIESYSLRLACQVDGTWMPLTDAGTRATLAELAADDDSAELARG